VYDVVIFNPETYCLFPDVPFNDWIDVWKLGYAEEYGSDDDEEYFGHMQNVRMRRPI